MSEYVKNMIFEAPEQSSIIKNKLSSGEINPILKDYPEFEACFIILHPFLSIKEGHFDLIKFGTGEWPNKKEILEHTNPITWNQFLNISRITNIQMLDEALAFYHRAYKYAHKSEYLKLRNIVERDRLEIIPPQVDEFPEILENKFLSYLRDFGYKFVHVIDEFTEKIVHYNIDEQLLSENGLPNHLRLRSPDNIFMLIQDFDQRFSYIFSSKENLLKVITELDFEGFFCDNTTTEGWSYSEIEDYDKINWEEDMNLL